MIPKDSNIIILISILILSVFSVSAQAVKQWDIFELELTGMGCP
jgi:hypothetical protein